jgi:hypothetical protein
VRDRYELKPREAAGHCANSNQPAQHQPGGCRRCSLSNRSAPSRHGLSDWSENGATLFRIRHQRDSVALLLPLQNVAERTLRDISAAVATILQSANVQAADSPSNIREKPANDRGARKVGRPAVEAIRPAM